MSGTDQLARWRRPFPFFFDFSTRAEITPTRLPLSDDAHNGGVDEDPAQGD
jgi:hypothetical protein